MSDKYEGHTPEPWSIDNRHFGTIDIRSGDGTIWIGGAHGATPAELRRPRLPDAPTAAANAALIADAPALLRQRDELVEALRRIEGSTHDPETADIALAALAAVEGK